MFLSRRTTQEEYFDSERPAAEVAEFFRSLGRVNRIFDFSQPFRAFIPKLIGEGQCQSLSILDVGAGDGSLGRAVTEWANRRGWTWTVVNVDCSPSALALNPRGLNVVGSASRLPFRSGSFDVVVASQMAHHLPDAEVTKLLEESWRVARRGLVLCDLHRNIGLYLALWLLFCFQTHPASFRADALLSVKRGWRIAELARLANQAGVPGATVKLQFGARIILLAQRNGL